VNVEYGAPLDGYLLADFPWFGLDSAWTGRRWLMDVAPSPAGTVDYGCLGHGDEPSRNLDIQSARRFAVVITVGPRPQRRSKDGTGVLDATSVNSAAWLAGAGLLSATWPMQMDRTLRQEWSEQQTALAWELADELDGPAWTALSLPVNGTPERFHYRESDYGWVLAGEVEGVHLGAYGRGVSAYGLGLGTVTDLNTYSER
jgi:hypothetical protein